MNQSPLFYDIFESTMGPIYLVYSGRALCGVSFEKPSGISYRGGSADQTLVNELTQYFDGGNITFSQEVILLSGTEFERQVWTVLKDIPFGETRSYKWVAERVGKPSATRAVGRALSKNPVPVILPCHRVIEAGGSLGGFSAGIERKRRLLDLEYYTRLNVGG